MPPDPRRWTIMGVQVPRDLMGHLRSLPTDHLSFWCSSCCPKSITSVAMSLEAAEVSRS
ncbi:Hypothetical protein FKW44_015531 [Caligus rogercresseyi]|uniref:Uncharacterized protein n=1 Tax=Caligus rogercresseyi TaxID=217165 RepID=A0A7T8K1A6_CALRO|nr:Hypothetical protein FKW44_015531 [Caligus rogercresseyi]